MITRLSLRAYKLLCSHLCPLRVLPLNSHLAACYCRELCSEGSPDGQAMASPPSPADAALGCLLGAAVGDAAGAVLEFQDAVSAEDVAVAMAMPGGGCWSVGPGQFTDDTELALILAHGLTGQDPHQGFPAQVSAVRRQG